MSNRHYFMQQGIIAGKQFPRCPQMWNGFNVSADDAIGQAFRDGFNQGLSLRSLQEEFPADYCVS
jgi:hypothetical protein